MKRLAAAVAMIALGASACAGEVPGVASISLDVPHHHSPVRGAIWYPAGTGGEPVQVGENGVFVGVPALAGAAVAEDRLPLVLLSHGLGGRMATIAWLPAGLARRGAIVVGVNHPGSTTWDVDMRRAVNHWTRVHELQAALDHVMADPVWKQRVDASRVMAAGFSFGGWTVLSMGGVTGNLDGYAAYCESSDYRTADCSFLARAGIDLRDLGAGSWNASYKDARVTAVAAIDPALHHGLGPANVKNLVDDVLLIGLGEDADRYPATDFSPSGSGFSALLPHARTTVIAPAGHFSALPACKPNGPAILRQEGDDPICDDPTGADRDAVHRRIVSRIAERLGLGG